MCFKIKLNKPHKDAMSITWTSTMMPIGIIACHEIPSTSKVHCLAFSWLVYADILYFLNFVIYMCRVVESKTRNSTTDNAQPTWISSTHAIVRQTQWNSNLHRRGEGDVKSTIVTTRPRKQLVDLCACHSFCIFSCCLHYIR